MFFFTFSRESRLMISSCKSEPTTNCVKISAEIEMHFEWIYAHSIFFVWCFGNSMRSPIADWTLSAFVKPHSSANLLIGPFNALRLRGSGVAERLGRLKETQSFPSDCVKKKLRTPDRPVVRLYPLKAHSTVLHVDTSQTILLLADLLFICMCSCSHAPASNHIYCSREQQVCLGFLGQMGAMFVFTEMTHHLKPIQPFISIHQRLRLFKQMYAAVFLTGNIVL